MTDALSEWFISEKQKAVNEISKWNTQSDFERRIDELRKQSLQNDDSAILIIKVIGDNSLHINYHGISVTKYDDLVKLQMENLASTSTAGHKEIKIEPLAQEIERIEQPSLQDTSEGKVNLSPSDKKSDQLLATLVPLKREKGFWEKSIDSATAFLYALKYKIEQREKLESDADVDQHLEQVGANVRPIDQEGLIEKGDNDEKSLMDNEKSQSMKSKKDSEPDIGKSVKPNDDISSISDKF